MRFFWFVFFASNVVWPRLSSSHMYILFTLLMLVVVVVAVSYSPFFSTIHHRRPEKKERDMNMSAGSIAKCASNMKQFFFWGGTNVFVPFSSHIRLDALWSALSNLIWLWLLVPRTSHSFFLRFFSVEVCFPQNAHACNQNLEPFGSVDSDPFFLSLRRLMIFGSEYLCGSITWFHQVLLLYFFFPLFLSFFSGQVSFILI